MIKEVKSIKDANRCDELLTQLILDEKKYNDAIEDNVIIKDHFSQMLDDEDIILLAYYIDNEVVGYILIRKIEHNVCLIDGLYVLEEYRNRGIATSLLNDSINRCKKLKAKYVDINVMDENEVAKYVYKKLDFKDFSLKLRRKI